MKNQDSKQEQLKKIAKLKEQIASLEKELVSDKSVNINEAETPGDKGIIKIFHKWKSPARVFVHRDRAWFVKVSLVAIILILFAAFLDDRLVIIGIASVLMVAFLLATVPPNDVDHQISSDGIRSIDLFIKWANLSDFWFAEKYDQKILYVETKLKFPSRFAMLVNDSKMKDIAKTISQNLDYKEFDNNKQSWLSKLADGSYIPPEELGLVMDLTDEPPSKNT